jgi:hypothetical protein
VVRVELDLELIDGFEFLIPALLEYLSDQALRGISLVILIKGALGLKFQLL